MAERNNGRHRRPAPRRRALRRGAALAVLAGSAAAAGSGLLAPQAAEAQAPASAGTAHYWYLKHGHWYWTSHPSTYRARLAAGAVGGGTAGPGTAAHPAPVGGGHASHASSSGRVHHWYLKHGHWYWTSHPDRYRAFLARGGIGNGTAGPDFTRTATSGPSAAPARAHGTGTHVTAGGGHPAARTRAASRDGSPVGTSTTRKAVAFARAQLGKPYVWGGNGPRGYDCSGLIQQAYLRAGVRLPRVTWDQAAATERISCGALRPGDLVHWSSNGKDSGAYHIALYLGSGRYIEAPRPGKKVRISTLAGGPAPSFYTRVTTG